MHTERVVIDKIVGGGLGLGRMENGMVFMAPYVLPGEEVLIRAAQRRKSYIEAEPVEVLEKSTHRVEPVCPHFTVCGGCDFQHCAYDYQLELKSSILQEHLLGAGIMDSSELGRIIEAPLQAPLPFGYRQRLRMKVEGGKTGFFRRSSHKIERIDSCPLAMTIINQALAEFRNSGGAVHLLDLAVEVELLASLGDENLIVIFDLKRKPRPADIKAAGRLCDELGSVKAVYLSAESVPLQGPYCGVGGEQDDEERSLFLLLPFPAVPKHGLPPYTLSLEAGGFSQVNAEQNHRMIETMLDWVDTLAAKGALDLFGGMGNFSIPLAMKINEVVGLDLQRSAIRSAERNAANLGLTNCSFLRKSALEGIREFGESGREFDLLLLDPPRRGCPEIIPHLVGIGASAIIYISCDPATLARDLKMMTDVGYKMEKIKLVDMFPQTRHLETMVLLSR